MARSAVAHERPVPGHDLVTPAHDGAAQRADLGRERLVLQIDAELGDELAAPPAMTRLDRRARPLSRRQTASHATHLADPRRGGRTRPKSPASCRPRRRPVKPTRRSSAPHDPARRTHVDSFPDASPVPRGVCAPGYGRPARLSTLAGRPTSRSAAALTPVHFAHEAATFTNASSSSGSRVAWSQSAGKRPRWVRLAAGLALSGSAIRRANR
jgi:hypothetical protein